MGNEWRYREAGGRKDGAICELFYSRMEAPEEAKNEARNSVEEVRGAEFGGGGALGYLFVVKVSNWTGSELSPQEEEQEKEKETEHPHTPQCFDKPNIETMTTAATTTTTTNPAFESGTKPSGGKEIRGDN